MKEKHSVLRIGFFVALPLCILLAAGCSKPEETPGSPPGPGGPMGGPGRMPGGGMGGGPVAENASGSEIYQAKCRCHGQEGKGGNAPALNKVSNRPDEELYTVIHDGRKKMPAFQAQLSEAQIKKVVIYLKQLKPGS